MKKHTLLLMLFMLSSSGIWAQSGTRHILLEEFSTAPCGFCPEGDLFARQIIDAHPQVIWVTHHAGFGTDAMTVPASSTIASAFTTFAPAACLDRGDYPIPVYTIAPYIGVSRQKWDSLVVAHLNDPPIVDVSVTNTFDVVNRLLDATVNINFIAAPTPGDLRLNLFLVEDSVSGTGSGYDQTNYFNTTQGHAFYNLGDPIVGYIHHHVIRKIETGAWGLTSVIPNNPSAGSSYSQGFTGISIPASWKEQDITLVAFVSYYHTDPHLRQVINSIETPLNMGTAGISGVNPVDHSIAVYPVPAWNQLQVRISGQTGIAGQTRLVILDATGRVCFDERVTPEADGHFFLDVSQLPAGVYFLKAGDTIGQSGRIFIKGGE